jgi:putative sigma-54 modulation protein
LKVNIRGKNIQVTDALSEYVTKKLNKLERYFDYIPEAQVSLNVERGRHVVEVTIPLKNGYVLRGEEGTENMYASVDLVVEKLEKQLAKYKTRLYNRRFRQGGQPKANADLRADLKEEFSEEADNEGIKIVKTKRFAFKPMYPEEAVMQMNLVGHDFFVFSNAETDEINVVYRRKDGNYGLIEPEF